MTRQADLKRRVRARMAKTGESYTAARAQVLAGAQAAAKSEPVAGSEVVAGWDSDRRKAPANLALSLPNAYATRIGRADLT